MAEYRRGFDKTGRSNWKHHYESVVVSASEAVSRIRPGQRVFIGTGCGQPAALVEALLGRRASWMILR